jgi:hypothetical protein
VAEDRSGFLLRLTAAADGATGGRRTSMTGHNDQVDWEVADAAEH